jgi:mono/diheme cytochrome c family protein
MTRCRLEIVLSAALLALGAAGCRDGMANQPKLKRFRESTFFEDRASARPLVPGTVPRGHLREDRAFYRGEGPDGKFLAELPVKLSRELLARGRERFDIFCSPCHGRTGDGDGMVSGRGLKKFKEPSSFHDDLLRARPIGYFFDVMTNGFGEWMPSYASQVPVADRWAIAAYIRALQLSRSTPVALLSPADLARLYDAARFADTPQKDEEK